MSEIEHTTKKKPRAALYLRVSTDEQAKEGKYGLQVQEERGRAFCDSQEYSLDEKHVYSDDISGGLPIEKRPKLSELFEAARNKEFDVVVVYKTDRLARNLRILVNAIHELESLSIAFRSVTEPFDTSTSFGRANLNLFGTFAEFEKEMIRERTMNGKIKAAKTGKWVTGIPPYGYRLDPKTRKLVPEPKEARVVRQIYTWLVDEKLSLAEIERRMNARQVPAPYSTKITVRETNNYWYKRTIGRILTNEVYVGTFYFRKYMRPFNNLTSITDKRKLRPRSEWIEMSAPAIITAEMFEAAKRQLLHNREFAERNKKREYLYSKLIYCSKCGHKMFGGYQPPRKKWEYEGGRYYHGIYRKGGAVGTSKRCEWCPQYSEARLEPIWECLKEILHNPKNMAAPLKQYVYKEEDPRRVKERLEEIGDLLDGIRKKRMKIADLLISDHITEEQFKDYEKEYSRDEQKLNDESTLLRQTLLTKQEQTERETVIQQSYQKIREKLDSVSYEEKARIISIFIERITLYAREDYAEVVFRFHRDVDVSGANKATPVCGDVCGGFNLVLLIKTISEKERRSFILRMNPGMYIPKAIV